MRIVKNDEISDELFNQMIEMDHLVWNADSHLYLTDEYIKSLYKNTKDAMFFAVDESDKLIGYQTIVFLDMKNFNDYYKTGNFMDIKNIGLHKGDNYLYLYTANIKEEYKGSSVMKEIGQSLCRWLDEKEKEGYFIKEAYSEAVSLDGVRVLKNGFSMEPMDDVKENGLGHYVSYDGLRKYRNRMGLNI